MPEPTPDPGRLEALFRDYTADRPGLSVLVEREGRVVCERYLGAADLEHGAAVTAETRFHIASVSKQFTALAALLLASRGQLDLDADVHAVLPELADYGARITAHDLIHHTSGLRDQWELIMLSGTPLTGLIRQEAILAIAARQRDLNFEPGTDIRYSNTGYSLLAEIVARTAQVPFRRFLQTEVFAPLGMDRTLVYDNASDVLADRAMSYRLAADGTARQVRLNYSNYGATSVQSTPRDLLKWSRELMHPAVFEPDLIRRLCEPGRLRDGTLHNYACGTMRDTVGGLPAITHGGADAGYRAFFASFPAQDSTIVALSNGAADIGKIGLALAELFLGASSPTPAPTDAAAARRLAGYYVNDWGPGLTLEDRDDRLHGAAGGMPIGDATFLMDGSFYLTAPTSPFVVGPDGSLAERQMVGGLDLIHRKAVRVTPTPADLRAIEGRYRSEELDVTYDVRAEAGGLVLSSLRNAPIALSAADADGFDGPGLRLRLTRDASGAITGLTATTGRVRSLCFERVSQP